MRKRLSLAALPELSVGVPGYERAQLRAGIVHFGVGNFHRAHQATYLDELFSLGIDHDWAIVGVGTRESDSLIRDALKSQDWLTTVVERDANNLAAHVTGAMIDFVDPKDTKATIEKLADPDIKIVSLTITEGGYFIDPASGNFDPNNVEILYDAAHIEAPKTVFGLILAGLVARKAAGIETFTVMSCDNIPGNGEVARDAVAGLAALIDADLADWVRATVAFPNAMVDRITPATSDAERALVLEEYGIDDRWPVACEPFRQWVVEDNFPTGRPQLEKVGVEFVADVAPYETMKIRILNGAHAVLAYPAGLLDIHFVHDGVAHPLINKFMQKLIGDEVIPIVPPIPNIDLGAYFDEVRQRFGNPKVGDTVRRLCLDGSNRQPKFILPSALDRLRAGQSVSGLALASAFWCRYCAGYSEAGVEIAPNDPDWARLKKLGLASKTDPRAFLSMEDIFGELASNDIYVEAFSAAVRGIWEQGAEQAMRAYIQGQI